MFIENIGTIDQELVMNSIPKYEKERLYYFRYERENHVSFAVRNGKTQELLMNGTAWEILQLCDGQRSVYGIIEEYRERYEYINKNINFTRDVVSTLHIFDKLWLLSWGNGGSPYMISKSITVKDEYTLTWVNESAIREIVATYEKYGEGVDCYFHNSPNNSYKGLNEYQKELSVRNKLFNYKEDFFLLRDCDNNVVGVVSVSNNYPESDILEVSTLIVPKDMMQASLEALQVLIRENYIFELSKLRIRVNSSRESEEKQVIYERCGFEKCAILKDEYGKGNDLIIFDYIFNNN